MELQPVFLCFVCLVIVIASMAYVNRWFDVGGCFGSKRAPL